MNYIPPIDRARESFGNAIDELMLMLRSIDVGDFRLVRYWAKTSRQAMSDAAQWAEYSLPPRYTHELYAIAVAADKAFSDALKARFGKSAWDARYRKLPADIQPLSDAARQATEDYLAACRQPACPRPDQKLAR